MKFCRKCGSECKDDQLFCVNCGSELGTDPASYSPMPEPIKDTTPKELSVEMLVFSIINSLLCTPLGIAAIILTAISSGQPTYIADKNLKAAKVLNIIGVVIGGVSILMCFVYFFIIIMGFVGFITGLSELAPTDPGISQNIYGDINSIYLALSKML